MNQTCLDKRRNSLVYSINDENRAEVISALLSHKYIIEYKKYRGKMRLALDFKQNK